MNCGMKGDSDQVTRILHHVRDRETLVIISLVGKGNEAWYVISQVTPVRVRRVVVEDQRPAVQPLAVLLQVGVLDHADVAERAAVWPDAVVHVHVVLVLGRAEEPLAAPVALPHRLFARVLGHYAVHREQVGSHAPPFRDDLAAEVALVLLTHAFRAKETDKG